MPPIKRPSGGGSVADIAGLMGPLGLPSAIGGVLGRAIKLSPDDLDTISKLLGRPIRLGKRLVRLSSGDPAANKAIIHTSEGERVATPLDELLQLWRTIGEDIDDFDVRFPEGAVISRPGVPAPSASFGPKGGFPKRRLPPTR